MRGVPLQQEWSDSSAGAGKTPWELKQKTHVHRHTIAKESLGDKSLSRTPRSQNVKTGTDRNEQGNPKGGIQSVGILRIFEDGVKNQNFPELLCERTSESYH